MIFNLKVAFNYTATLVNIVSVFIFVPFYIKYLGDEAFGVISFSLTLQTFLIFFDLGISHTLKRELATKLSPQYKIDLVRSVEVVFIFVIFVFTVFAILGVPLLGDDFLKASFLDQSTIRKCLQLMILVTLCHLTFSIYFGGVWGLNLTEKANIFQISFILLKNGGAIVFVIVTTGSIINFFLYQILISLVFIFLVRFSLFKELKKNLGASRGKFKWNILKDNLEFSSGLFILSLLAGITYQLDKLMIAKFSTVKEYSFYYIAFTLSQIPVIICNPLVNVYFPTLTNYHSNKKHEKLIFIFKKLSLLIYILSSIALSVILIFNEQLIYLWTKNTYISEKASEILPIIVFGGFIQALSLLPFQFTLSAKDSKLLSKVALALLLLYIPCNFYIIKNFGIIGGAYSWLIYNIFSFPIYSFLIFKKHLTLKLLRKLTFELLIILSTILLVFIITFSIISFFIPASFFIVRLLSTLSIAIAASITIINQRINIKKLTISN